MQDRRGIRCDGELLLERAEAGLANGDAIIACGDGGEAKRAIAICLHGLRSIRCGGFERDLRSGDGSMLRIVNYAFNLAEDGGVRTLAQKQAGEKENQYSSAHTAEASFV